MSFLIVDDNELMRRLVRRNLEICGYGGCEIFEARNGHEGLERIREGGIDLVLCDWNMPVMKGLEMLDALRKQGNDVPLGFITSEVDPDLRLCALRRGADFIISKPIDRREMALALKKTLARIEIGIVNTKNYSGRSR